MRILLLHSGEDADAMAERLRGDGHHVRTVADVPADAGPRPADPAQVLVVCLDSQPQRTLDLAARVGDTAHVPSTSMLFVGGTPAVLVEAQRRFPKASFARLDALSTALASMEA
jgi:hypothetical protein